MNKPYMPNMIQRQPLSPETCKMSFKVDSNPMYLVVVELLGALVNATAHLRSDAWVRVEILAIQERLAHVAWFPDNASHYCKVVNDQVLRISERAIMAGLHVLKEQHDAVTVRQAVDKAMEQMAKEDIGRFKAVTLMAQQALPGQYHHNILMRNAYGAAQDGVGDAYLESYADYLQELNVLTAGLTPTAAPDEAILLERVDILVNEGCPDVPRSSVTLIYSMTADAGLGRLKTLEMTFPASSEACMGVNARGFYAPDLTHTEAVKAFRARFYHGDPELRLQPACRNDRDELARKLTEAFQLADANMGTFSLEVNESINVLKEEVREELGAAIAPLPPLLDVGVTNPESEAFYAQ